MCKMFQRMIFVFLMILGNDSPGLVVNAAEIHTAIKKTDLEEVTRLIDEDSSNLELANEEDLTPIQFAVSDVNYGWDCFRDRATADIIRLLHSRGADVNRGPRSALHFAAGYGNLQMTNLLLELGANPNSQIEGMPGSTPFVGLIARRSKMSKCKDDIGVAKSLITHPAYVASEPKLFHSLVLAASLKDLEMVQFLIGSKVDANSVCSHLNTTALHAAAEENSLEVAKILLDAGADFKVKNLKGRTPLHIAAMHGHEDFYALIRDYHKDKGEGMEVFSSWMVDKDDRGMTACSYSVNRNPKIMLPLIEALMEPGSREKIDKDQNSEFAQMLAQHYQEIEARHERDLRDRIYAKEESERKAILERSTKATIQQIFSETEREYRKRLIGVEESAFFNIIGQLERLRPESPDSLRASVAERDAAHRAVLIRQIDGLIGESSPSDRSESYVVTDGSLEDVGTFEDIRSHIFDK